MQIWQRGGESFEIKTKQSTLRLSSGQAESKVNDVVLRGPGEYEIGDVQVRGVHGNVYRIASEDLRVVYLDGVTKISQPQLEELAETDILLVDGRAGDAVTILDPKVVIPFGDTAAFCKSQSCPDPVPSFKVSKKDLTDTQRKIVILK